MCRWLAYSGKEVYLENLLFKQENSLISQSLKATRSNFVTNGDGFGVAWYGENNRPGIFKDVLPAWNDENLKELSQHIKSNLFFAHVRAATGTSVSRMNCHPYRYGNWTFMHNGHIGDWHIHRREVEAMISTDFYGYRSGTTDSEALFLLVLSDGLEHDPIQAISSALEKIGALAKQNKTSDPLRFSAALTNGQDIWAFRYSSDQNSPSLFYGHCDEHDGMLTHYELINTVSSEPIDSEFDHWKEVEESSVLVLSGGKVRLAAFMR